MNNTYSKFLDLIENALQELNLPAHPEKLYDPIRYTLGMKGKRLRPLLTLIACDLAGGDPHTALPAATGIEIFHNFTLLHDDIMDQAPLRRGMETVHKKWNTNVAILSGDTMFALAFSSLLNTKSKTIIQILETFTSTAIEVCEGQQLDMDFEIQPFVTLEEYIRMIRLKTAVLLGASLKIGALAAESEPALADDLYDFGTSIGIAFQLQDDFLDTFGTSDKFGKYIGGDILAAKKTFFYVKCLELADSTDKEELIRIYSGAKEFESPEHKIDAVRKLFARYNLQNQAISLMEEYFTRALEKLKTIRADETKKEQLAEYARWLYRRDF